MTRTAVKTNVALPVALALMAVGCQGMVVEPGTTVAKLSYFADMNQMAGLVAKGCVARHGNSAQACPAVVNAFECETLDIIVKADGRTHLTCKLDNKIKFAGYATFAEGSPIVCKASEDLGCTLCYDTRGAAVVDTCNDRGAQMFRTIGSGWGDAPDTIPGLSVPPTPSHPNNPGGQPPQTPGQKTTPPQPNPSTPPPGGGFNKCDWQTAVLKTAQEINKELMAEGLKFSWSPNLSSFGNPSSGFWGFGKKNKSCAAGASHIKKYWLGNKNCTAGGLGGGGAGLFGSLFGKLLGKSGTTCRCYRIGMQAAMRMCASIPSDCDRSLWSGAINMAYAKASQWLFAGAPGAQPPTQTIPPGNGEAPPGTPPGIGKPPTCLGSPLVLDLGGNGIAPTSAKKGTTFDLMGVGALKTAWVKGDDALLVLDRNGNGKVDNGTELFGDMTLVDGVAAGNGFAALAVLDKRSEGGNGNGRIDAGDKQFSALKVWRDRNGDGVSQPSELSGLAAAGVKYLSLKYTSGQDFDAHGNDLGMRGAFVRSDGTRGAMIDVLFVTKGLAR